MSSRKLNPASTTDGHHAQPYRKKYGKSLHKLHATAPPPPIASLSFNSANSSSKQSSGGGGSGSVSGGLLLLSTKKGNSEKLASGLVSVTSTSKAGKKGLSTHDALLSVLNGEKEGKKEFVPLAWGMKSQKQTTTTTTSSISVSTNSASQGQSQGRGNDIARGEVKRELKAEDSSNIVIPNAEARERPLGNDTHGYGYGRHSNNVVHVQSPPVEIKPVSPTPNHSRAPEPTSTSVSTSTSAPNNTNDDTMAEPPKEDQVEFMKKLAKERAEKRRLEEDNRVLAQKERAALRLKELELKMKEKEIPVQQPQQQQPQPQTQVTKSLYDPDRPYSSLLGGGGGKNIANKPIAGTGSTSILLAPNRANSDAADAISDTGGGGAPASPSMIQINYEDRGSRSNAGPRMLFDPKSGSMIAAPGARDKKSSKKKPTTSSRSTINTGNGNSSDNRNGDGSTNANANSNASPSASGRNIHREDDYGIELEEEDVTGSRRKNNSRSRQREVSRKTKKREENSNAAFSKARKGVSAANKVEDQSSKRGRTLPRTCGVLYKKDAKGHLVSADGCEGDQGYGAHSVAGGRIRNPNGYSTFKRKGRTAGKQGRKTSTVATDVDTGDMADSYNHSHLAGRHALPHASISSHADYDYNRGLNRSHFMRKNQQQQVEVGETVLENGVDDFASAVLDVVTGDEKLDLLSGLDESPKLQATAVAWAPSEAVLALAAANAKKVDVPAVEDSDSHDEISHSGVHAFSTMTLVDDKSEGVDGNENMGSIEASPSIGLGLGFDPSQNMDSLMMSPAIEGEIPEAVPDLPAFTLKHSASTSKSASNPFVSPNGLLGSSTWGTSNNSNNMGSLSNWDLIGSKTTSSDQGNEVQKTETSSAFLSLGVGGSQTTWGSGNAFAGFNGIDNPSMGNSD
jgi:hypothetical protein